MPVESYQAQFDEYLISRESLLNIRYDLLDAINELLSGTSAENISSGIIGGSSGTSGIEVNSNPTTSETFLQSKNFVTGSVGWKISSDGSIEANAGTFRGALVANSIDIPNTTTANSFHVNSTGDVWWGAATIGSAVAKVLKTGVATFTNIVATGTINAIGGYLGAPDTVINISTSGLNVGTTGHIRGGQTDYNTDIGWFLGYSTDAYKFSIGDPSSQYLTWDGSALSIKGVLVGFNDLSHLTSETLQNSNNAEMWVDAGTYTKIKETKINENLENVRIKLDYYIDAVNNGHIKIYRNGVEKSTEHLSVGTGSYSTITIEDLDGFVKDDLIQVYVYSTTGHREFVKNFRFYYDKYVVSISGDTLVTPLATTPSPAISVTNNL